MTIQNAHAALVSDVAALTSLTDIVKYGAIPSNIKGTLLKYLWDKNIFKGYPVAEGETFRITGAAQATSIQIVIYEKYDAGDIKPDMDNGSIASKYMFINYGRVAANITTTGDTRYTVVQSPAEFPDFPFGDVVPSQSKITLFGIMSSEIADDRTGGDTMQSAFIKLVQDRITLFDEDTNGILMLGIIGTADTAAEIARGVSLVGNYSSVDNKEPFMLPEALQFGSGEELNVYLTTIAGAAQAASDLLIADVEMGLIEIVEKSA
jgi:hypothetical protein